MVFPARLLWSVALLASVVGLGLVAAGDQLLAKVLYVLATTAFVAGAFYFAQAREQARRSGHGG